MSSCPEVGLGVGDQSSWPVKTCHGTRRRFFFFWHPVNTNVYRLPLSRSAAEDECHTRWLKSTLMVQRTWIGFHYHLVMYVVGKRAHTERLLTNLDVWPYVYQAVSLHFVLSYITNNILWNTPVFARAKPLGTEVLSPEVNWPGREADLSPPSNAEVNAWS
jgi:hypothetical protein